MQIKEVLILIGYSSLSAIFLSILLSSCTNAQNQGTPRVVGGPCDGCEAIFEYGDKALTYIDTLPDFHKVGNQIKLEGTIYHSDGKTPAQDIILYVYHTDQEGRYTTDEDATGGAKRHGYNRGWVKTGKNGKYIFYTVKPAPYPNNSEPAHIHFTVLEPNGKYYWLESSHFKGDSLLTKKELDPASPRGGNAGLLDLKKEGNMMVGTRDIILGRNIPDYE